MVHTPDRKQPTSSSERAKAQVEKNEFRYAKLIERAYGCIDVINSDDERITQRDKERALRLLVEIINQEISFADPVDQFSQAFAFMAIAEHMLEYGQEEHFSTFVHHIGNRVSHDTLVRVLSFFKSGEVQNKKVQYILEHFWKITVGRPRIVDDPESPGEEVYQQDEIVNTMLNSEHACFATVYRLPEATKKEINQINQMDFFFGLAYTKFHEMLHRPKEDERMVRLVRRKQYSLIVAIGDKKQKIIFPAELLEDRNRDRFIEYMRDKSAFYQLHMLEEKIAGLRDKLLHEQDEEERSYLELAIERLETLNSRWKEENLLQSITDPLYAERIKDAESGRHAFYHAAASEEDISSADLMIQMLNSEDCNDPDIVHESPHTSPLGNGIIGGNIMVGIGTNGQVERIADAHSHIFIDGADSQRETIQVVEQTIEGLLAKQKDVGRVGKRVLTSVPRLPEISDEQRLHDIYDFVLNVVDSEITVMQRDSGQNMILVKDLRERSNEIFQFYQEKYGVKISLQSILEWASMMVTGMTHDHFIEISGQGANGVMDAGKKGLYPALTVLSEKLQSEIREGENLKNTEDFQRALRNLIVSAALASRTRKSVKEREGGPVALMYAMARGVQGIATHLGGGFSPMITRFATKSTITSMLVRNTFGGAGERVRKISPRIFVTTTTDQHPDCGFGATDTDDRGRQMAMTFMLRKGSDLSKRVHEKIQSEINRKRGELEELRAKCIEQSASPERDLQLKNIDEKLVALQAESHKRVHASNAMQYLYAESLEAILHVFERGMHEQL